MMRKMPRGRRRLRQNQQQQSAADAAKKLKAIPAIDPITGKKISLQNNRNAVIISQIN